MITTIAEAEAALADAMNDYAADTGESGGDDAWFDLVVATAHLIIMEDPSPAGKTLAREFCRRQVGSIPQDLEPYLGKKDWIK